MDRLLSAPSTSKEMLKRLSSHTIHSAMCAGESNQHCMDQHPLQTMDGANGSHEEETSSVQREGMASGLEAIYYGSQLDAPRAELQVQPVPFKEDHDTSQWQHSASLLPSTSRQGAVGMGHRAQNIPSPSPSPASTLSLSASSEKSLLYDDFSEDDLSENTHEASGTSPELVSDGEESLCSSGRTSFDWARNTHSPLPAFVRDQKISSQKTCSLSLTPSTSDEERFTLNTEEQTVNAEVNGISQQWLNTNQPSVSPSPSLPSSCGSAASNVMNAVHQAEDCGQTCRRHNKYLNFDYSVIIHPPPPSPLSYTLSDLSGSSEDGSGGEEKPAAVSKSVKRKLVAERERRRREKRELADRKERDDRRQKRQVRLQELKEEHDKREKMFAEELEKERAAKEEQERIGQELTERASALWEAEKLWQAKYEERQSQRQKTKARKKEKKERKMEKKQMRPSAWVEEEEDETHPTDSAELPPQPRKRNKIEIFWKGFGKNKKKKEKKKEKHQLEDEQVELPVWGGEYRTLPPENFLPTQKGKKSQKKIEIVWKGFGKKKKKKEKNQQQDQLEEQEAGPSVRAEEERGESLPIRNAEMILKPKQTKTKQNSLWKGFGKSKKKKERNLQQDQHEEEEAGQSVRVEEERCQSLAIGSAEVIQKPKKGKEKQNSLWKGFGKNKNKKEKNQQQDQLEEKEAGSSIRAEKSLAIGNAEQSQNLKKSKKKSGLFQKLLGKEKKKQGRYDKTGLSVWAAEERSMPLSTDSAEMTQKTKKSRNKSGLLSKLFGEKKKKRKENEEQLEETRPVRAEEYGTQVRESDLSVDDTEQETHPSMASRLSFSDLELIL